MSHEGRTNMDLSADALAKSGTLTFFRHHCTNLPSFSRRKEVALPDFGGHCLS